MDIEYEGVKAKAEDIFCTVEPDGEKAGLTLYVRGYKPEDKKQYLGIAYLMLDQALGEYDVETKVGFIEVKPFEAPSTLEKKPLKDLPKTFDSFTAYKKS